MFLITDTILGYLWNHATDFTVNFCLKFLNFFCTQKNSSKYTKYSTFIVYMCICTPSLVFLYTLYLYNIDGSYNMGPKNLWSRKGFLQQMLLWDIFKSSYPSNRHVHLYLTIWSCYDTIGIRSILMKIFFKIVHIFWYLMFFNIFPQNRPSFQSIL